MSTVIEFTMHAKPGHYDELLGIYSEFAQELQQSHSGLNQVLIIGDPAAGLVRGIGVFNTPDEAEEVNSEAVFADFNASVEQLITGSPERVELHLVHSFTR